MRFFSVFFMSSLEENDHYSYDNYLSCRHYEHYGPAYKTYSICHTPRKNNINTTCESLSISDPSCQQSYPCHSSIDLFYDLAPIFLLSCSCPIKCNPKYPHESLKFQVCISCRSLVEISWLS